MMINDTISLNMEVVDKHIALEAADTDAALELYTDDIVWESPTRQLRFEGKDAVAANYRRMFSSLEGIEVTPVDRFATEDKVVDDAIVRFTLTGDGFINPPVAVAIGDCVELRLVHVFGMRDGKIASELTCEMWRVLK
jgi:steroid delta-isomerase-like uncharacterized protein